MAKVMARATASAVSALLLGTGLLMIVAGPVAAECDGPIPPFREYAPTANRIVIGTVTRIDRTNDAFGRSPRFTLRVTDVLRGPQVRTLEVRDLAYLPCSGSWIQAALGEQIALAIGAHGFDPPITFATMAWIRATAPVSAEDQMTRAEVVALVRGAPDTDAEPPSVRRDVAPAVPPVLALAALAGVLVWLARTRRRGHLGSARSGPHG